MTKTNKKNPHKKKLHLPQNKIPHEKTAKNNWINMSHYHQR